jgi:hypothetical protein
MRAKGLLDLRSWRSSMVFPHFAIAAERENEWKGDPSATRDASSAEPSPLLRPLWLLWCLFGAQGLEESSVEAAGVSAYDVECDLDHAQAETGLNFMRPPDSSKQILAVQVTDANRMLKMIAGEAYLGRASVQFLPARLNSSQIDWRRIGALWERG